MRRKLQPLELRIAQLVAEGYTNQRIATELRMGLKTVENYIYVMRQEVGLANRAQLAAWFVGNFPTAAVGIFPPSIDGESPSSGASEAR